MIYIKYQNKQLLIQKNDKIDELKQILLESDRKREEGEKKRVIEIEKLDMKREEAEKRYEERYNRLISTAEIIQETVTETKANIKKIIPERVRLSNIPNEKHHVFMILKDTNDGDIPYYVVRCQSVSVKSAISKTKRKYPGIIRLIKFKHPSSVDFWNEIKIILDRYINHSNTKNWFGIKEISESIFIKKIKKINKDRLDEKK